MNSMDWTKYVINFRTQAYRDGKSEEFINDCLEYASCIYKKNLPIIYDQCHLAKLVGYDYSYLLGVSNSAASFYSSFSLPKKSKGKRIIFAPYPSLKEIQRWVLDNILSKMPVSMYAKAYVSNRNIKDNAKFHVGRAKVLRLDIKDFFPSIGRKRIFNIFAKGGYCRAVVAMLTNMCTLNGALPQGAPTSPALSNLVFVPIDKRIGGYSAKQKIYYTRYADDLIFSGDIKVGEIIALIKNILSQYDFTLNESKIRVMCPHNRQLVTGIVVNDKMNAPQTLRREILQAAYYIKKFGIISHFEHTGHAPERYMEKMIGKALFVLKVNPELQTIRGAIDIFKQAILELSPFD